ncbi:hypothetical protein ABN028_06795 [Actinopolymorpha sp. B17G11]|uniref:hypothetical protein n=1 Tax=Actinopolymorpha sp. B17G11 TaxID=3160861 RepID=UPI0032E44BA8
MAGTVSRVCAAVVRETCFLVDVPPSASPALGHDPELSPHDQVLAGIAWRGLDGLDGDVQVGRALPALRRLLTGGRRGTPAR